MSAIDIKLKSYDELIFEITTLNTNKYLLEQKLNKQKEVLDKIKEKVEYYRSAKYGTYDSDDILADLSYILLEEI